MATYYLSFYLGKKSCSKEIKINLSLDKVANDSGEYKKAVQDFEDNDWYKFQKALGLNY